MDDLYIKYKRIVRGAILRKANSLEQNNMKIGGEYIG